MSYRLLLLVSSFLTASAGGAYAEDGSPQKSNTEAPATSKNVFTKPGDIHQGRALIRALCSRCHGMDGKGGKGPDLTDGVFRHGETNEEIIRNIRDGIPGTGMPGIGDVLDEWNWQILSYLRAEASKRTRDQQKLRGDSVRGYELFKKHKCASCHWGGSSVGRRGPNLARLHATADYVRKSLLDPDSQIDGSYQPLTLLMNDGSVLQGMRLHENTYYVLLIDEHEVLKTIPKSRIDELRKPHKSLMPGFAKELNARDVEDLTAYIFSLQEEPKK